MSFVLSTVLEPLDIVDAFIARLIGQTEYLVVARSSSIEIYSLETNNKIKLEHKVELYETILDIRTITLFNDNVLLVIATESNKVLICGFNSLQAPYILEELILKTDGGVLSIQHKTLQVDPFNRYISFYTMEGLSVIYPIDTKISQLEFKAYLDQQKKKKKQLIKPPIIASFPRSNREAKVPMIIERMLLHGDASESYISVLFRDDLFQYYFKTFTRENDRMRFISNTPLPEKTKPIIINSEAGIILFGKTGLFLKALPYYTHASVSSRDSSFNEGTSIQIENDQSKQCYVKKSLPIGLEWDVTSAAKIQSKDPNSIKVILTTSKNEVYLSTLTTEHDPSTGELFLEHWTLDKLKSQIYSPNILSAIKSDIFIAKSALALTVFKINTKEKDFEIIQEIRATPPIMDFNITGTTLPKIQTCGGSDLVNGYIKTEFMGYESESRKVGSKLNLEAVLNFWKFDENLIVNTLEGVHIFKLQHGAYIETSEFHGLEDVDGNVLDLSLFHGQLTVITDRGVYINGKKAENTDITTGFIQSNCTSTYVSGNMLTHKARSHKVGDDVSAIFAFDDNKTTHILVGHWDGLIEVFINDTKKTLKKSHMAIHSVLIKKLESRVKYITGDAEGNIDIFSNDDTTSLNIGDSPVTVADFRGSSILCYNAENVVLIELDKEGEVTNRGYLTLDIPSALRYDSKNDRLLALIDDCVTELSVREIPKLLKNETYIPKLVRKSVKFKNFLHLSLFVINATEYNEIQGQETWKCELHVINNNTFRTESVYKFDAGVEITDVINTQYHKELIDTYEEENIGLAMENILSQCFVVSCSYGTQDDYGPPLMLFSVDEFGQLQYQCSCPKIRDSFQSLTNHGNRIIIGAGDSIIAYKVEYSIADSKFTLKKISDPYHTKFYTSHIKSAGPDVLVGDLIRGISRLEMKVKAEISDDANATIFKFEESLKEVENVHFLTALETFKNLVITADSLKNVKVQWLSKEESVIVTQFNLNDQINSIKCIDRSNLTSEILNEVINGNIVKDMDDITPVFVLGSINGGVYLLSLITAVDLIPSLEKSQESIIKKRHPVLSTVSTQIGKVEQYANFKSVKGYKATYNKPGFGFIDGDLIKKYDTQFTGELVTAKCVLL